MGSPAERSRGRPRDSRTEAGLHSAALDILCEQGFAGMTVERVCERAGVPRSTFYRRWSTANEAVISALSKGFAAANPGPPRTGSFHRDIKSLTLSLIAFLTNTPAGRAVRFLLAEAQADSGLRSMLDNLIETRRNVTREVVLAGVAAGEVDPRLDVDLVLDILTGPAVYRTLVRDQPADPSFIEAYLDRILIAIRP